MESVEDLDNKKRENSHELLWACTRIFFQRTYVFQEITHTTTYNNL